MKILKLDNNVYSSVVGDNSRAFEVAAASLKAGKPVNRKAKRLLKKLQREKS